MNQKEITEIIVNYLNPIFLKQGYKYKKGKWNGFVKQYENGFEYVNIHFFNYWTIHQSGYSIIKRFNIVEQIYDKLANLFDLNKLRDSKTNGTFCFNYESLNNLDSIGYLEVEETKLEVLAHTKKAEKFILEVAFPMLEKCDLKTIDAEINGNFFWETDRQEKFTLGGGFPFKRLIIAKITNNSRFEVLYKYHLDKSEAIRLANPQNEIGQINGKNTFQYLVEVLLKDIQND